MGAYSVAPKPIAVTDHSLPEAVDDPLVDGFGEWDIGWCDDWDRVNLDAFEQCPDGASER
jgi:hypothetical protein